MTLAELLEAPLPDAESLRQLALLFDGQMAQRMVNIHAWYGNPGCTVYPAATSDGEWFCPASVLPDCIAPDGAYHAGFSMLDQTRFGQIQVVALSSIEPADPQPPQIQPEPNPTPPQPNPDVSPP